MWSMLWNLMAVIGIMCSIGVFCLIAILIIDDFCERRKRKKTKYVQYFYKEDAKK